MIAIKNAFKNKGVDYNKKLEDLINWSDYETVQQKATQMQLGEVYPSWLKSKKYVMANPYNYKIVHFGQMGFEDGTKHRDPKRIKAFRNRNYKWASADPYTPAFLAYYLLW